MPTVPEKKRYSLSLTTATMEKLHEQFAMLGVKSRMRAAGHITLMVDDFLNQMAEHIMPVVIEAKKTKTGEVSEVEFMRMVFQAMSEIRK